MGRYYDGDIEGKFWFGIQDSSDGDFFGKNHVVSEIGWEYSKKDLPKIEEGLEKCKANLDEFLSGFYQFFVENDGYNDEMLLEFFNKHDNKYSIKLIRKKLTWYARLLLGKQIQECVKDNETCYFRTSDV